MGAVFCSLAPGAPNPLGASSGSGNSGASRAPNPLGASSPSGKSGAPAELRLKLHTFRDVTMGVVSYSVVLPEGWTSSGQTEWSGGELSYPQHNFEINSPAGGRIRFLPAITQTYTEVKPLPGMQPMPPRGMPAPVDFPRWLVEIIPQTNPKVSNVMLIDSRRDQQTEERLAKQQRDAGIQDNGMRREAHVVTIEYDEQNVRRREDLSMLYVRYAPIDNQNIHSQMWSIFTTFIISAPREHFDATKPELYTIAGSLRPTPQWWTQSQAVLVELSRMRMENRIAAVRRRGEMINQMTDDDYARYKKSIAGSDAAQHDRINTIYETEDFRDSDGAIVNLPIHYQHVFSDGKGNFVLSNNSQSKPGELWNEIQPMK
jgi:hypothetical protein